MGVLAFFADEGGMFAVFDDFAFAEDDDAVEGGDGAEAVGDDDAGAVFHEVFEGVLDEFFGFGVEGGSGFVEDEDWGVF